MTKNNNFDGDVVDRQALISKYVTKVCYLLILLMVLTLFVENFIFSESFIVLRFREIDDVAFQETLRRVHLLIESSQYSKIWEINDYAYGWVFWAPLSFLTYPLYLLSAHAGIDWPLIVAPRQLSLLFSVMSLPFLSKLLFAEGVAARERAIALLIFTLFPTFGFFSLKFGTVSAVMFFSIFSAYLAIRDNPSTGRGRVWIVLSLAMAGGIKLSALLIAPLVFLLVVFRYRRQSFAIILRDLIMAGLLFSLLLVVFTNPALMLAYFYPDIAEKYWGILSHFMAVTHIASGSESAAFRFYQAVFSTGINFFVMLMLVIGMLLFFAKEKKVRLDLVAIAFVVLLAGLYLGVTVKNGNSIGVYFTSVSFLFLFGVAGWARTRSGFFVLILLPFLLFVDLVVREQYELNTELNANDVRANKWNHLTYFVKDIKFRGQVETAGEIAKCMGVSESRVWPGHVFIDFTIPTGFNSLSFPKSCVSVVWNNLSPAGKYCDRPLDYIVLDKTVPGSLPQNEFEKKLASTDERLGEALKNDRAARIELAGTGAFNNQRFKRVCDLPTVQVFEAIK